MTEDHKTAKIKKRYNRIAPFYSRMDHMVKESWRKELFSTLHGNVLEVGVGTGANLPYYPNNSTFTAIDFSPKMLSYAKKVATKHNKSVQFLEMDVQNMDFGDNQFDYVVSTCVFCSVPDPIKGLEEIKRVLKRDGSLVMLEHMRSDNRVLGKMMDVINPLVVNIIGANINRKTIFNVQNVGFHLVSEKLLMGSIMKELKFKKVRQ
ncbi:class I SAM-dependent methyltransferase [Evansella sp. AB-P1]|uniref:class I SAM-dependent methyltransferase n=1 Tax=Evansella sp. AB-P1 TaxID=3037653 RepID=UPI00241F6956|nr:class I SAM-dependent methyltransferase [Evansella sp. AB-P1]MDG5787973.1 class I SAM-dependent methyltransferase [Evansella sp. AB-P1]